VHRGQLDASTLRSLGSGGTLAPPSFIEEIGRTFNGRVSPVTGYGLTETTAAVTAISGPEYLANPTSIGRPIPTVRLRVVDDDGFDVARGDAGELLVAGPEVSLGYYNNPELTSEAFVDGWFHTGDRAIEDEQGLYHLVGRIKDVVIRAGENIYCAEVESTLAGNADVVEAAVFGRPHDELGEDVVAIVRLRPGATVTGNELREFVAQRLAVFKVPVQIAVTDAALPRTPTGKLLKSELRVEAARDAE
jgi:acyl-CoA synthetase (AMP-forming)/AMP-acid ligase II